MARPALSVLTRQNRLIHDASGGLGFIGTLGLTQAFAAAVGEVGATTSRQLQALAGVFGRVQTDHAARTEIHTRIARLAQTATVQAYGQRVVRQEGAASRTHYRAGAGRLAAGKMLEALSNPDFVEAGPDGINFGNTVMLDRIAAQWHRLNFGAAGGRQGESPAVFEVRFNNLVVAAFGFTEPPSPGFAMPRGFFTTPEGARVSFGANPPGSDVFTPKAEGAGHSRYSSRRGTPLGLATRQTAGIRAKNFFDAGLARIAEELGPAYMDYYRKLFADAKRGVGPLAGQALARPTMLQTWVDRVEAD